MISTLHAKHGTWIVRKDRMYCPKCGKRLNSEAPRVNQQPQCTTCDKE